MVYNIKILARICLFANGGSYRMIIGTFTVYFIVFTVLFSGAKLRKKEKSKFSRLFAIPAFLAFLMALLTVIKVYFIYKLVVLLFVLVTVLLSYWQWGDLIRRWWK
jgi:hypothetical protein